MLLDMFSLVANKKGIEVVFEFDDSGPEELMTDEHRIKQVLLNLI